ncbi:MAG TPA: AMP-binding protein, partial [Acidobacteriota bacterium]|nr:AMP-binding protein [Acidobacteriota bacterium]
RTMDQFCDKFAAYGFHREAMSPVYGLAECSVGLTGPPPGRGPNVEWIDRHAFTEQGKAVPVQPNDPHAMPVVGCGFPFPDHQVRVVDKLGYEVPDRVQGKIQFRGPSATVGYFRNPEATAALFRGEWLETGDLGYIAGGEIFIAGRSKDIIIRAGRNLYPQELEDIVGNLPGVRTGCVAVFACSDTHSGTERLVIVAETRETSPEVLEQLRTQINQATLQLLDSAADEIVLAPPHSVLKTSSGKIRRSGTRDAYLNGDLFRPRSPFRDRLNALKLKTAGTFQSMIHRTGLFLFGAWCWLVFVSAVLISCVLLVVIPTLKLRRSYGRWLARLVTIACGMPVAVDGAEHLPTDQACVYVANHASYIDAIVIMAILPPNTCFT